MRNEEKLYRRTPLMGWASWNCFRTGISEEILKKQADALISTGLAACGYTYFNIDDGFFGGRSADGKLLVHKERFPNGMKVLADYVHELGLKAGIYAEGGDNTCGHYYDAEGSNGAGVGLYGWEEQDLRQYLVEWDYDFIKVDWCGGIRLGLDDEAQYQKIGRIIDKIREEQQKCIVYNVCRWQFPGAWVTEIADSWRTGADISPDFDSVLYQLDMIKPLRAYCRPGHVNDLDMLQVGNGMSAEEDEAHFAMWCMMSTPLMLGCDLTKITESLVKLVTNQELIAINQDSACLQAYVVKEVMREEAGAGTKSAKSKMGEGSPEGVEENAEKEVLAEIWIKDLGKETSNEKAVAFLNRSKETVTAEVTFEELGLGGAMEQIRIRDVLNHDLLILDNERFAKETWQVSLKPHSCRVYRIKAEKACPVPDKTATFPEYRACRVSKEEIKQLTAQGAILADVRFPEEYGRMQEAEELLKDAVRIPYYEMHASAKQYLPDKNQKIILCCNTGKKSSQAARSLFYLGYTDVCYTSVF